MDILIVNYDYILVAAMWKIHCVNMYQKLRLYHICKTVLKLTGSPIGHIKCVNYLLSVQPTTHGVCLTCLVRAPVKAWTVEELLGKWADLREDWCESLEMQCLCVCQICHLCVCVCQSASVCLCIC